MKEEKKDSTLANTVYKIKLLQVNENVSMQTVLFCPMHRQTDVSQQPFE